MGAAYCQKRSRNVRSAAASSTRAVAQEDPDELDVLSDPARRLRPHAGGDGRDGIERQRSAVGLQLEPAALRARAPCAHAPCTALPSKSAGASSSSRTVASRGMP